ncbi:MAG: cytochrome c [Bacteroidia bacterium]|nr:cytochrome c [Bacteroidia bacterium]
MKKVILSMVLTAGIISYGCNSKPDNLNQKVVPSEVALIEHTAALSEAEGMQLLETHCFACHSPKSVSHDEMLAPPLAGIKHRYKTLYPDRNTFISRMTAYISKPSEENAVMRGPVRRFGLMPPTTLEEEKIRELTAFIYDNSLPAPKWFPKHFEEKHGEKWN